MFHIQNCNKSNSFNQNATYHRLHGTLQRNKHHQPSAYDPGKKYLVLMRRNNLRQKLVREVLATNLQILP